MKQIFMSSAKVAPSFSLNKHLKLVACFMLSCFSVFSQHSTFYYPVSPYVDFNYHESYVFQKFTPSTNYPFDGTIKIQRVEDPTSVSDAIQITLVKDDGTFLKGFFIFEGLGGTFTPTCAAYNSIKKEYCIAGINDGNTTIPNTTQASWFLLLDLDLNVINAHMGGVDLTGSSPYCGPEMNLLVTDVTSVEGASNLALGDFVYVGVAGNATDPSPTNNTGSTEKEMYIGYVSSGGFGFTRAFDFGSTYNDAFFPSRVIEIPMSSNTGGFMITGTGPLVTTSGTGAIFFSRTNYAFQSYGTTDMYAPSTAPITLSAGDLFFDKNTDEIWFAGTGLGSLDIGGTCLIFNKIVNLTTTSPGITMHPTTASTMSPNPAFGITSLFSGGIPKIAKIMPTLNATVGAIASNFYENNYYLNNTATYPMLNKIDFDDLALDDFSGPFSPQSTNIYTYTRFYGNIGLGNYLPYLSYINLFYPSHNAHEMPLGSFPNESYVLGGTTLNPTSSSVSEYIVINRTDNYFDNPCNFNQELLELNHIDYYIDVLTPGWGTDALNSYQPSQNITDISSIVLNNCNIDAYFKSGNSSLTNSQQLHVVFDGSRLKITTSESADIYNIYNTAGALVLKGRISSGYAATDLYSMADGLYLIEILDFQNKRIATEKIIK